ncbi:MAG: PASTA domain-containing protein [Thermoleophilaceae bacterium]|nr:PASTA domain-containing protein [Thermoleophilaceae bacterium]
MARSALLVPLLLAAAIAGCGDDEPSRPVQLTLVTPSDGAVVHTARVEVRGRVSPPGARVLVAGRPATVTGGEFRASTRLGEGSNVIDVAASADGARTSWAALRVARQTLVRVPDVAGLERDEAVGRLEAAGLRADVDEEAGGLLDRLLGTPPVACETEPGPEAELPRGARVRVLVSRGC